MTRLHNEIMNIPVLYTRSCFSNERQLLIYKEGHKDARHEAAEMALFVERKFVQALELIAVGDVLDPKKHAVDVLIEMGYWTK